MSQACYVPQTLPVVYPLATSCAVGGKWSGQCVYFMSSIRFAKINRICSCWKWGSCLQSAGLFWSPLFWFPDVPCHVIGILQGCVAAHREWNPWGSGGISPAWAGFSLTNHWGKLSAMVKIQKPWILSCKNWITCSPPEKVYCALKYQAWFLYTNKRSVNVLLWICTLAYVKSDIFFFLPNKALKQP